MLLTINMRHFTNFPTDIILQFILSIIDVTNKNINKYIVGQRVLKLISPINV